MNSAQSQFARLLVKEVLLLNDKIIPNIFVCPTQLKMSEGEEMPNGCPLTLHKKILSSASF